MFGSVGNKQDVCVIGMGRYGRSAVNELVQQKRYVLALDKNKEVLQKVVGIANQMAVVDATDVEGLKGLGLKRFQTVVVAASNNIGIVATLTDLKIKHIIAKAETIQQERLLKKLGANIIIKPEIEAGIRTGLIAANPNYIKYVKTIEEIGDDYAIVSTTIHNENLTHITLSHLKLPKQGINIVSIKRKGKIYLPEAGMKLKVDDLVTMVGKNKVLLKTINLLGSPIKKEQISKK